MQNNLAFEIAKLSYFGKISNVKLNLPPSYNTISLFFCVLNTKNIFNKVAPWYSCRNLNYF